jgi:hypothetical protein
VIPARKRSKDGPGHGPFTATRPGSQERGASLVDQQGTVLRLLIQLSGPPVGEVLPPECFLQR